MSLFLQGILLGLTLAILLGPIFVTITQLSLEKGARAGMTATSGVWISDVLIISACYFFVQQLSEIISDSTFTYWMGLLGGFILIVFGIGALLKKTEITFEKQNHSKGDYFNFWTKGFLVNTINPFTFVFWIGVISTYVIGAKISGKQSLLFFGTILSVIIITDTMKVFLAKAIRNKLRPHHFQIFARIAGIGLITFGIVLLLRSNIVPLG